LTASHKKGEVVAKIAQKVELDKLTVDTLFSAITASANKNSAGWYPATAATTAFSAAITGVSASGTTCAYTA